MELFVINLDRSKDRFEQIAAQFKRQNLTATRIKAIDAHLLSETEFQRQCAKSGWKYPLGKGEVSCFLSHKKIWQQIAEGNMPYAAIFEDDARLSNDAHKFLSVSDWIPEDADIVKIETRRRKIRLAKTTKSYCERDIALLKGKHLLAAGYIVSKKGADKLLAASQNLVLPADHFLFNFDYQLAKSLKIYQLDPAIIVQAGLNTTIELENNKPKLSFVGKVKREVYRNGFKFYANMRGGFKFLTTGERWKRVPFK